MKYFLIFVHEEEKKISVIFFPPFHLFERVVNFSLLGYSLVRCCLFNSKRTFHTECAVVIEERLDNKAKAKASTGV